MTDRGRIISEEERIELLNWICQNYYTEFTELNKKRIHYFYRGYDGHPLFQEIRERIMRKETLEGYSAPPVFQDDTFIDIIACVQPGGELNVHKDTNHHGLVHIRYNVFLLSPPDAPATYYGGHLVEPKEGHYTLCRSGLEYHWTERNCSTMPRITLSYGFLLSIDEIEKRIEAPLDTKDSVQRVEAAKQKLQKMVAEEKFKKPDYIVGNNPATFEKIRKIHEYRTELEREYHASYEA